MYCKDAEIRCIKYYHAIYVLFAQCERHLRNCAKIILFKNYVDCKNYILVTVKNSTFEYEKRNMI